MSSSSPHKYMLLVFMYITHLHRDWLRGQHLRALLVTSSRCACAVTTSTGHHGGLQDNANLSKSFARRKGESEILIL